MAANKGLTGFATRNALRKLCETCHIEDLDLSYMYEIEALIEMLLIQSD